MKRSNAIILIAVSLVLSHFTLSTSLCFASDYYLHTTTSDDINNNAPTAATAKFKDSPAVNRTTYQQIGIWSTEFLTSPMQLESLSSLVTWIGLKNSDDQGTYFDLRVEVRKNGAVIASGETKNIQGVTLNPANAKQVTVSIGAISDSQFNGGDILSVRILTKVADSGGHNSAVGLRTYYDAVTRQSKFGLTFASPAPTKLVITAVNGGATPVAGMPFSVTVQSQDASGAPANVSNATAVGLSLKTGTGTLGGTLTGTIAASSNQVTITGVTYTRAESDVVITATRTSGDNLTAADSVPFSVNPGAAANVAFATQPGSATAGSAIPGPPRVGVQDNYGNTVTSSTIYITVALGTNPGGSTLSGNSTIYTSSGIATFNDLSLNKAGLGYTLVASSPGLTGATSNAFNINPGAAADLVVHSLSDPPTSAVAGGGFLVTDTTGNIGDAAAAASTTRYYLSSDNVITDSDQLLAGSRTVPILASGAASAGSVTVTVPTNVTPGNYFLAACADDLNFVAESNEANRCRLSTQTVTISSAPSITSATPTSGAVGTLVQINGANFGTSKQSSTVTFNGVLAEPSSWSDTTISVVVPGGAATGPLVVTVGGVQSNSMQFTVSVPTIGLMAAYGFEEGQGLTTADSSGNGNTGTIVEATWTTQGKFGKALIFNGSNSRVTAGSITLPSKFTLMAWVFNPSNSTLPETVISIGSSRLYLDNEGSVVLFHNGMFFGFGNLTNNAWHHVAVTNVGNFCGYVDGVFQRCSAATLVPTTGSIQIGARLSGGTSSEFFSGTIDEVQVYDHALTQGEIQSYMILPTGLPKKLGIASVNNGVNPSAGVGFPVTVQARNEIGVATNVSVDTVVSVSLKTGSGNLSGTLTGTIAAGSNQVTLTGVSYNKAESGIVITAVRSSGETLASGDSAPFAVIPGAATSIDFSPQPGNSSISSILSGPPAVVVKDALGNIVLTSSALISLAIGNNAGGGILSGTTAKTPANGIATFNNLSINQAGNGYTLIAASPGLPSVTSSPFNITVVSVGTITGVITRVSNGTAINAALVEVYQGTFLRGSAVTNSTGNYSITGLTPGDYTVRASYTGLVPRTRNNVTVTNGGTTAVSLSLNFGIAVQSPIAGATINDFSVLVTGLFDTSLAPEVGITVNGYVALIDGDEFATFVPIDSQTTIVTATITDTAGNLLAGDSVPITPQLPATDPLLNFRPSPVIAFVTQPVNFTLTSLNEISQVQLDGNGEGTVDFTGATLDGVSVTFAEPGLYFPSVTVTEPGGTVRTATALMQVLDMSRLDVLLTSKWNGMKNALRSGNTAAAADYVVKSKRVNYQNVFNSLTIPFANIDQVLTTIAYAGQSGLNIEYEMLRLDGTVMISYMVVFVLDEDGVWRIKFF